ncbi:hypothetical protein FHS21_005222 [Phyllobacterium trifolii]|uniref:Uncharacterized protein n=1 Tax=Phyllobacterium trifolii TaxID=300193 RepID=A0A839UG34_9HYPH|nr:hypothetical protein [Phyllobacterium trifolii]MBB3148774.1 hypothetical protein [Phyllobacterium trifolii]
MVGKDVVLKLALALQYAHHANFAGTPRQAIADGYSAIDAALSALLAHDKIDPPRIHKHKLDQVRKAYPNMLAPKVTRRGNSASYSPGGDWTSIESYYRQWLESRYSRFDLPPAQASSRVVETHQFVNAAMRVIARKMKISAPKLNERAFEQAFGVKHSELGLAVGMMHDRLFSDAEQMGEIHGSKLGTKLASTTNYCELDIITGDALTQAIIGEDEEIAMEGARVYAEFNKLAEKIIEKRLKKILGNREDEASDREALNLSPNFMLSMKARYHGATVKEMGDRWGRAFATGLGATFAKPRRYRKKKQAPVTSQDAQRDT